MSLRAWSLRLAALPIALLVAAAPARSEARLEYGGQLGFPLPSDNIGNTQLGVDAGATITLMDKADAGFGLDLIYHHWPVSAGFQNAFDAGLMFFEVDSDTWALSALQATMHVKFLLPRFVGVVPWGQLGAGYYRVDPNLEFEGTRLHAVDKPGFNVSAGFDRVASPGLRLGLDATYHHLWTSDYFDSDYQVYSVGMHLLFGR